MCKKKKCNYDNSIQYDNYITFDNHGHNFLLQTLIKVTNVKAPFGLYLGISNLKREHILFI